MSNDLAEASKYIEYLKKLPTLAEAERELHGKSEDELRAMVIVWLSGFKQRQFTLPDRDDPKGWDEYCRWTRLEPLDL